MLLVAVLFSACGGSSSMSGTGGENAGGRGATAGGGGAGRGGAGGTVGGDGGAGGETGSGGSTAGGGAGGEAGSGGATAGGGAGGGAGSGGTTAGGGAGGGAGSGGGAGRGGAGGASGTGGAAAGGGTGGALPTNIAFVTSTRVTADLGGVAGADTICQMHAQSAGLAGIYRAWLASSAGSAPSRLGAARGWRRADGLPIADTAASLLGDPRLFYLLVVNERGARTYSTYVWTGTRADGGAAAETCGDWTSEAEGQWGATGNGNLASIAWTAGGRNECATTQPLYCFGIDHANPVTAPAPPNPSRVVFTSRPFTLTSAGIAAADAFCTAEATAANLPGTYGALLAPSADAANARFEPTAGGPWARVDGVVPSATPLASTTQSLRAALNVTSDGTYLTGGSVWTGALTPVDVGSTSNCNAFASTSSTASSVYGTVHDSSEWWSPSPADSVPCNATTLRLYCLQR